MFPHYAPPEGTLLTSDARAHSRGTNSEDQGLGDSGGTGPCSGFCPLTCKGLSLGCMPCHSGDMTGNALLDAGREGRAYRRRLHSVLCTWQVGVVGPLGRPYGRLLWAPRRDVRGKPEALQPHPPCAGSGPRCPLKHTPRVKTAVSSHRAVAAVRSGLSPPPV